MAKFATASFSSLLLSYIVSQLVTAAAAAISASETAGGTVKVGRAVNSGSSIRERDEICEIHGITYISFRDLGAIL